MQSESLLGEDVLASRAGLVAFIAWCDQLYNATYVTTIKEMLIAEQTQKPGLNWEPYEIKMPAGWGDYVIKTPVANPHEGPVKEQASIDEISESMLEGLMQLKYFDQVLQRSSVNLR